MSKKHKMKRPRVGKIGPSKATKADPQFEVTCKFSLPENEEQFLNMMNGPKWKNLVRVAYHTLQDWRDYAHGEESKTYDSVVKFLRNEMAIHGLSLADAELIEEGYRRTRVFWAQAIAKQNEAAEKAAQYSGTESGAQIDKIVSSGESEAERAALDFAIKNGFNHGGACRHGRPSESGSLDGQYQLSEMVDTKRLDVIERNLANSDGTVLISVGLKFAGLAKIEKIANKHCKPWLHVSNFAAEKNAAAMLCQFIEQSCLKVLNVIALSSSEEPDAADFVRKLLSEALLASQNRLGEESA